MLSLDASAASIGQSDKKLSLHDLPLGRQSQIRDDFDWLSADEFDYGFFTYKGTVHHISEFLPFGTLQIQYPELRAWDAYESDTYFSGTVIRVSEDGETVVVGS